MMFRQVFKQEEDLAPPRESRKRSREERGGESVPVKKIKKEHGTAATPTEGNGFQQANVSRPFPRCRRWDGHKCSTCGKEYRVEGWLHRHYRKFPAHDPAEIQRREEQRREEQRKRMREVYFRALVAEYEQKEAAKARRRPLRQYVNLYCECPGLFCVPCPACVEFWSHPYFRPNRCSDYSYAYIESLLARPMAPPPPPQPVPQPAVVAPPRPLPRRSGRVRREPCRYQSVDFRA